LRVSCRGGSFGGDRGGEGGGGVRSRSAGPGPVAATRGGSSSECLRAERPTSTGAVTTASRAVAGTAARPFASTYATRGAAGGGRDASGPTAGGGAGAVTLDAASRRRASRARGSPAARIASRIASVAAPTRRRFVRPTARIRRRGTRPPGRAGSEVHSARSSREPTRVASGTSVARAPFYPKPRTPDEMQVCWTPRPAGREKIQRVSLVSSDNSGGFATGKQSEKNTPESMMVIGRDADPRLQTCPMASNPLKRATFPVAVTHTTPRRRRAERRESAREAPLVATRRLARLGGASPLVPLAGFRS